MQQRRALLEGRAGPATAQSGAKGASPSASQPNPAGPAVAQSDADDKKSSVTGENPPARQDTPATQPAAGEFARLVTIPTACQTAHELGQSQLWVQRPFERQREPGPTCLAVRSCLNTLRPQTAAAIDYLKNNPAVFDALRREVQAATHPGSLYRDLFNGLGGIARDAANLGVNDCTYLWSSKLVWWLDPGGGGPNWFGRFSAAGQALLAKVRSEYTASAAEYKDLSAFNDRYTGVEALDRAYAAYRQAFEDVDIARMIRERPAMLQVLEQARARKQLLTQQSAQISRYEQTLSDLATALDREFLTAFADQQMRLGLDELKHELQQLGQSPPANRGDISVKLEIIDTRVRGIESAVDRGRARKQLLTQQSAQISRYEQTLSDFTVNLDREALRRFFDQRAQELLSDLGKELRQLDQTEPWKRGDISSKLDTIAKRIRDVDMALRAARSEKATAEQIRMSLVEDESATRHLIERAASDELKAALDERFVNSANQLINRLRELESLDLWILHGNQEQVVTAKTELEALQKRVSDAQIKYDRAKRFDEMRRTVMQKASTALSEFAQPEDQGKLSSDGLNIIAKLKAQFDVLSGFDAVPLVIRPDYSDPVMAAEDALDRIQAFKAEMRQVSVVISDLKKLNISIDERGRELLDASASSELAKLINITRTLSAAKIPLSPEGHRQLMEARTVLANLEHSVYAVMDREEKRIRIRELPTRSGAWAFRFDTDKMTDQERVQAVGHVEGSQAKYELSIVCRRSGPEFLITTFEHAGTAPKRIPWDINSAVPSKRVRLRIDSNRAFAAQFLMHGYGNHGEVRPADMSAEFKGLLDSSRLVFADIFEDEQVEVATNYPPSFRRLCELIGQGR